MDLPLSLDRSRNLTQSYDAPPRTISTNIKGYLRKEMPSFGKDKRFYGNVYHNNAPQIYQYELCLFDRRQKNDKKVYVFSDLTNIRGESKEQILNHMGFFGIALYNMSVDAHDGNRGDTPATEGGFNTFGGPERKINDSDQNIYRGQLLYWDFPDNNEKIEPGRRVTATLKPYDKEIMGLSGNNIKERLQQYVENGLECASESDMPLELLVEQIYMMSTIVINSMIRKGILKFKDEDEMGIAPDDNEDNSPEKIYQYVTNNEYMQTEKFLKDLSTDDMKRKEYGTRLFVNKSVIFSNLIIALKEFCPEEKRIVGKALSDAKKGQHYDYLLTQSYHSW